MFTFQLPINLRKVSATKVGTENYCLAALLLYISIYVFLRSVQVYGLKYCKEKQIQIQEGYKTYNIPTKIYKFV